MIYFSEENVVQLKESSSSLRTSLLTAISKPADEESTKSYLEAKIFLNWHVYSLYDSLVRRVKHDRENAYYSKFGGRFGYVPPYIEDETEDIDKIFSDIDNNSSIEYRLERELSQVRCEASNIPVLVLRLKKKLSILGINTNDLDKEASNKEFKLT